VAETVKQKPERVETLPVVAEQLREWLPELNGRAVAITEAQVEKDNVPDLPIALVYPLRQDFTHNGGFTMTVEEEFVIEIWLEPVREKSKKGESPFWSYYQYNTFRNKMFAKFASIRSPQNGKYTFISMDVESSFLATVIAFRMRATYELCVEPDEWEKPAEITFSLCQPASSDCLA
jgi:hypothetical protein